MTLTTVSHILSLALVHRSRVLPYPGRVLVHESQRVKATDIIATCVMPGNHLRLDLCAGLGIKSVQKCTPFIERKVGDVLQKGDIIAQTKGVFKRIVRAPGNGFIIALDNGTVLLEVENETFELKAGYAGIVHEILPEIGAVIEFSGVLLQGVWGNGQISQGVMVSSNQNPGLEFSRSSLDVSMRGSIWVGSFCLQADALQAAAEISLRGLVLSSISAELIPLAIEMPFPIIVMEGFGTIPLNLVAYKLLSTNDKREVCLNACAWDRMKGERPEITIPLPTEGKMPEEVVDLAEDQNIHICLPPNNGKTAIIKRIHPVADLLPSLVRAPFVEAATEAGEKMNIPIGNFEVLG